MTGKYRMSLKKLKGIKMSMSVQTLTLRQCVSYVNSDQKVQSTTEYVMTNRTRNR